MVRFECSGIDFKKLSLRSMKEKRMQGKGKGG
jgi:hypothetical protein